MIDRIRATLAMVVAAIFLAAVPQAQAADYPEKPISVIVGYPAGGPTDVFMRALGPRLTQEWGQPIVVENKPGANESIAAQYVARAQPDGYTLLISTEVPLTQNQFLYNKLQYNPEKDFAPVSRLLTSPLALVVPVSLPVNSLAEFIALAKTRAASGNPLAYGSAGTGGVLHLPMAMLAKQNGLEMTHVPYKGVAPLINGILSGDVSAAWVAVAGAAPFVRDHRLKALVVDAPARIKALSEVPVFKETSTAPVQADFIFALIAPAGTPSAITEKVARTVKKIMADAEFRGKYMDPYGFVAVSSTPVELEQYLAKDRPLQAERIKLSGAKPQD
jgi:tripartite-type tricarboxylate transporter receptor subunit TctC